MNRDANPVTPIFAEQSGLVLVEFLIAFVPIWTFFLCIVQLAFMAHANLVVKHAADSATRSAIVVLPDDPQEYGGESEMSMARNRATANEISRAFGHIEAALDGSPTTSDVVAAFAGETLANLGGTRLNTIRLAAHVPLLPVAPANVRGNARPSLAGAINDKRRLLGAIYYQPFALAVTFPGASNELVTGPEITVRVTYAFQCTVPFARRVLCSAFGDLPAQDDLAEALAPMPQRFAGGRFRILQHETTLMIHDAPYEYRAQGS